MYHLIQYGLLLNHITKFHHWWQ